MQPTVQVLPSFAGWTLPPPYFVLFIKNGKKGEFKTLGLDIFLDIYFCPFSKISADFLPLFLRIE
jgi:hypothetical protein